MVNKTLEEIIDSYDQIQLNRFYWKYLKFILKSKHFELLPIAHKIYTENINLFDPLQKVKTSQQLEEYHKSNFHGGCNDHFNTKHENIFYHIFPFLKKQVVFGTGKNGYKKYLSKKYTADFVDPIGMTIIEIDGYSHKKYIQKIKDQIRDKFFDDIGYDTVRFTNKEVENLYKYYLNIINVEIMIE